MRDRPVQALKRAKLAGRKHLADLHEKRLGPHVEHDGKHEARVGVRGHKALGVGFVDGDGFLDEDVQPVAERVGADGGVGVVRCGNEDGVRGARPNEVFAAGELSRLRETRQLFRYLAADSGHLAARDRSGNDLFGVSRAHGADADDT